MDRLTFTAKLIEFLVWPSVVIIIFFALKAYILNLFPFLKRLRYKDFEVEFGEKIRELTERARTAIPDASPDELPAPSPKSLREQLYDIAELSPRTAIVEAWLQVEHAAQEVIKVQGLATRSVKFAGPKRLREYLEEGKVLTPDQRDIFQRLRNLRNQAVHFVDVDVDLDQVYEYIDLALALAARLRKVL